MDSRSMNELTTVILDPARPWTVIVATRDPDVGAKCALTIDLKDPACQAPVS